MTDIQVLNPAIYNDIQVAQTVKKQYAKNNIQNFIPRKGSFAANAVLYIDKEMNSENIRKLTPSECYRLMDMDESNIQKIVNAKDADGKQLVSDTQQYATAGNGIVVACLEFIFHNMFISISDKDRVDDNGQFSLF